MKRELADWKRCFKMTEYNRERQIHEKHEAKVEICRLKCEILGLIKHSYQDNRGNEGQTIFKELITDNFSKMVKNRATDSRYLQIAEAQYITSKRNKKKSRP